uniref:Uncharacterized protein n=1 Tax=Human betaherpesvirus 6 TaxID=10368 RepID=A0A5P9ULI7_9BETA|nr:hypothetical protein [Human betaherpesvirus 6]QFW66629.1 hypothetical protein [Human betaherpesvirus 6]QFW95481.1 hypothetical protein [Human betaherpesvirus 6]QFW95498.1 hypothetical protein [Human betaherpesvirus 6]
MRKYTRHGHAERRQRATASMASIRKKKHVPKTPIRETPLHPLPVPPDATVTSVIRYLRVSTTDAYTRRHTNTHNPPMW